MSTNSVRLFGKGEYVVCDRSVLKGHVTARFLEDRAILSDGTALFCMDGHWGAFIPASLHKDASSYGYYSICQGSSAEHMANHTDPLIGVIDVALCMEDELEPAMPRLEGPLTVTVTRDGENMSLRAMGADGDVRIAPDETGFKDRDTWKMHWLAHEKMRADLVQAFREWKAQTGPENFRYFLERIWDLNTMSAAAKKRSGEIFGKECDPLMCFFTDRFSWDHFTTRIATDGIAFFRRFGIPLKEEELLRDVLEALEEKTPVAERFMKDAAYLDAIPLFRIDFGNPEGRGEIRCWRPVKDIAKSLRLVLEQHIMRGETIGELDVCDDASGARFQIPTWDKKIIEVEVVRENASDAIRAHDDWLALCAEWRKLAETEEAEDSSGPGLTP